MVPVVLDGAICTESQVFLRYLKSHMDKQENSICVENITQVAPAGTGFAWTRDWKSQRWKHYHTLLHPCATRDPAPNSKAKVRHCFMVFRPQSCFKARTPDLAH